jgi:hypothetical protein
MEPAETEKETRIAGNLRQKEIVHVPTEIEQPGERREIIIER